MNDKNLKQQEEKLLPPMNQEETELEQATKQEPAELTSLFPSVSAKAPSIISPTLLDLPLRKRPKEASACQLCPAAQWMYQDGILMCYCQKMNTMTYSEASENDMKPILSCDGMYQALDELLQN